MYTHTSLSLSISLYIYIYIYVSLSLSLSVYIYIYIYTCMCVIHGYTHYDYYRQELVSSARELERGGQSAAPRQEGSCYIIL